MDKAQAKKEIYERLKKNPEKLVPFSTLAKLGFKRQQCSSCHKMFWAVTQRDLCGDVECLKDYTFFDRKIAKSSKDYRGIWQDFSRMFAKSGHKEIKRYPVVARWRDDIYFVEAAIDDFAPYVIQEKAEAPANPLVVPQICLRFNDIENVGLSGRHLTSFIMAEEAAFNTRKKKTYFDKEAIGYIYKWLVDGLKIERNELTFVEDAWVGAGYAGNSLEFFAGGLELGNQVYMRYLITEDGLKELSSKTIDMGAGLERWAWISKNTPTIYEATFPEVIKYIKSKAKVDYSDELLKKVYKFSGMLDFESSTIDDAADYVSKNTSLPKDKVRKILDDMRAVYSIADHTRTLLIAIHDSSLPSNVGGGYNLRNILRRSLIMLDEKKWDINLNDVIEMHKKEFGSWFTELKDIDVSQIINKEKERYYDFMKRTAKTMAYLLKKQSISTDELRKLYESEGITPEDIRLEAENAGIKIYIPPNFEKASNYTAAKKEEPLDVQGIKKTEKLFYNEKLLTTKAKIIKLLGLRQLILDRTIFYPEMGGQKPDLGMIDGVNVLDVKVFDDIIVHYLEKDIKKKAGGQVELKVDSNRRELLRRHHTATHIINQAARIVLGDFVYQNGAEKDVDKAHLDITYFEKLTDAQIKKIEEIANETVANNLPITVKLMDRTSAETKYGMRIYQGGSVPNSTLRIVSIEGYDTEACGGLHCHMTGDVGLIKIIKSERIQDGVVRLVFKAYKPALEYIQGLEDTVKDLMSLWGVKQEEVYRTAERFFSEAKSNRELYKKSEQERISTILGQTTAKEIDGVLQIETKLNELGFFSALISKYTKPIVIFGESIGLGKPKNDKIKELLSKRYKVIADKNDFVFGHN